MGRYPRAVLEPHDVFRFIGSESAAAAATISPASLDAPVPSCPDWSLTDLIWHLGRVQRFWATTVRAGDAEPEFPPESPGPSEADELEAWFRASTDQLLEALHDVDWDTPAWTWWKEDRTVGAIARHQVQEAAVHRWDAQLAGGGHPDPLTTDIADDGVDEFLWIARQMRGPEPIAFKATDTRSTFTAGTGKPVVTVSAPASDLVLLLYGRVSADDVAVRGDRAALDAFLLPIG
jgi:uncharacterized protein (TIGR03083 family)